MKIRIKNGMVVDKSEIDNELNYDFYKKYLVDQNLLLTDIEHDILHDKYSYVTISTRAKNLGFSCSSRRDAVIRSKNKYEKTMIEKYGVTNPSKSSLIKEKKIDTYIRKYGVNHPLKDKKFLDKVKETCFEKYGVSNVSKCDIIKEKKSNSFMKHYGVDNIFKSEEFINNNDYNVSQISKASQKFFNKLSSYLDLSDIECYYHDLNKEYVVKNNGRFTKLDFCVLTNTKKYCIEFNGSYWHCDPFLYDPNDTIFYFDKNIVCSDKRSYDLIRIEFLRSCGFEVKEIWENDILENEEYVIMDCLKFLCLENN